MPHVLAATALAVISQFAAQQPYRPTVKVAVDGPRLTRPLKVKISPQGRVTEIRGPQVLCTMPMIRPAAPVDTKIVVEPPKNGAKIRTIDAPTCIER